MGTKTVFEQVVFSGGGNRCIWQGGFYSQLTQALSMQPQRIGAVSAGAAVACVLVAGRAKATLRHFKTLMGDNPSNFYPLRWLQGKPAFPHAALYRQAILDVLSPAAFQRLQQGPEILVQLARHPPWLGTVPCAMLGLAVYELEKKLFQPIHPRWSKRLGFNSEVVSTRDCDTPQRLVDLLLASSCTPPFTPLLRWNGGPVLDGGLVDNVPVDILPRQGRTLILLTRRYQKLPLAEDRVYVQPSADIAIQSWDYTNPGGLQETFDLGQRDAERFVAGLG